MNDAAAAILKLDLKGKIRWLIALRWLAAAGLAVVITGTRFLLAVPLPLLPLYSGNLFLILYNGICYLHNRRLRLQLNTRGWIDKAHRLANIQIFLDLLLLTYLIAFSGGLENPFLFYYIFHMIISSILLTNRSAYLQATFASLLFAMLIAADTGGVLPHHVLGPASAPPTVNLSVLAGRWLAFSSTLYIAVYLTTTIVNKLRQHERELERTNRLLAEQDQMKSQYVLIVSHDIQSSLSAIESCLQTVLHGFTGTIGEKTRDMVQRANLRARHLMKFVRDLLDVSRMRARNELVKEPVNLEQVMENQIEMFRRPCEERGIALRFENHCGGVSIQANSYSMEQLFNNLLSNALRYTPDGGRIRVSLDASPERGEVEVSVADSGIGIDPQSLPRIFDDFYRAGNARQFTESGTGLGLAIVKKIVELHGGTIRVLSEAGTGSTFVFTLKRSIPCPEGKAALH